MKLDKVILNRISELIQKGENVKSTRFDRSGGGVLYLGDDGVNFELANEWGVSCLNLLNRIFGKNSDYYLRFNELFSSFDDYSPITKALGILRSAKEDYELGMLFEIKSLIEAEVFDTFLEQSNHLLNSGYYLPAAVLCGAVLENGLRILCERNEIEQPEKVTLNKLNSDLAKKGIYSKLTQKKITVIADVRNKAAHGKLNEFTKDDVEEVLGHTRRILEDLF